MRGLLAATRSSTALAVTGIVVGLEPREEGMWQLHRGFSFDGGSRRAQDAPAVYLGAQWGYCLGAARAAVAKRALIMCSASRVAWLWVAWTCRSAGHDGGLVPDACPSRPA